MSTDPSITRRDSAASGEQFPHPFAVNQGSAHPDVQGSVDQTKSEIRQLVSEMTAMSQAEITEAAFL
ncbi:MAG: hypothetical protein VYE64_07675, partial [Planctomycetota bacterium]|nr:hypothetical protein [Planctomycetota bacterium]